MTQWSFGVGRYAAGEKDLLGIPSWYRKDGSLPGIVYCHGAGEQANTIQNPAGNKLAEAALLAKLAAWRPIVSVDFGTNVDNVHSTDHWGNANAQARLTNAIAWLQNAAGGGAKASKVALVAISMGSALAINFAKNNGALISCIARVIPVSDLNDIYQNNRNSYQLSIANAWGIVYPAALPGGANPKDVAGTQAIGIPEHAWYADNDPIVMPQTVIDLSTAIGGQQTSVGALGHSDLAIGTAAPNVLEFLAGYI